MQKVITSTTANNAEECASLVLNDTFCTGDTFWFTNNTEAQDDCICYTDEGEGILHFKFENTFRI